VWRIRDVYPGSQILIFTHPGSRIQKQQQKRGVKKICCYTFLCSHKFHKIVHYFSFEVLKKKIWANFQRITVGAQSIARAQSIAPRHTTYVIIAKKFNLKNFCLERLRRRNLQGGSLKKRVYFCL
jgi:hypothetical protein